MGDATGCRGRGEKNTSRQAVLHAPSSAEKWLTARKLCITLEKNISWILSLLFILSLTHSGRPVFLIIAEFRRF